MAKVTRTTNPLHFEDLEPHKFEDVVRGLLYDFRDWQVIEPTGKGGSDDGYDARAWEKVRIIENEDEDSKEKGQHPMEGNRWMVQCKRERTITPKKIEKILKDVDPKDPPYGYILAAPADFSKISHDKFREILLEKEVTEFYLWSKGYLEDQLYLPKNDHILFTTFGFSLNTRRRSRKTEIRFALNNKNKIFRIWGKAGTHSLNHKPVLIRDFSDENYPFEGEYDDFKANPRWIECIPFAYHPLGIWVHIRSYYAFVDADKKEFDFYKKADLLRRESEDSSTKEAEKKRKLENKASGFWQRLPIKNQAKFAVDALIYFKDILLIDDKGDSWHAFPHIFVEFARKEKKVHIPAGYRYTFETDIEKVALEDDFKRIKIFPKKFAKHKIGTVHKNKLDIPHESLNFYGINKISRNSYIFDLEKKYGFLKKGDTAAVPGGNDLGSGSFKEDIRVEVTQVYETTAKKFFDEHHKHPHQINMEQQNPERKIKNSDKMTVFEVRQVSGW